MANPVSVKICGISTVDDVRACAGAGANYMGLVFFEKSPRNITIPAARDLALAAPMGLAKVALVVNPSDAELDAIAGTVPLDMIQLHGRETPERVAEVKARYGLPVMKAVGIADANDLPKLESYFGVADQILVDAKPPKGGELPGGNGLSFDWRLIAGRRWPCPWMLAGGLTPENVAEAVKMTGTKQVDVSSGVEDAPGQKNAELIQKFVQSSRV
ncbi:phosphoribosylanthranilate isomerase [Neptunomonas phycophila]|uniref:phosphoribosylanthranilate isomerase n=1 Tax=Neptunomonas phycophila TaxID=1572645 RepID=UPI0023FA3ACE|nr:phosphoribosylanthranilate isomerase [Neptunomonas phycophila]